LIDNIIYFNRGLAIVGALFLFLACAGKVQPWKFDDVYSIDAKILNTKQWSKSVKKDFKDLKPIVKKQLDYYLEKDLRIYERLNPNYNVMKQSITLVDSLTKEIIKLMREIKRNENFNLDSISSESSLTYRKIIESKSLIIINAINNYEIGKKGLIKGFKKVRKRLIFINNQTHLWNQEIYALKYKRGLLDPHLDYFNKVLSKSIFSDNKTVYSDHIIEISKDIEGYLIELDKYEKFLSKANLIGKKEVRSSIALISYDDEPFKYEKKYIDGKKRYLLILKEIRKLTESV